MAVLKRLVAPKFWKIPRLSKKFILSVKPGPHSSKKSYPLGVVLRDILKFGRNLKEVKKILNMRLVEINGRIRTDPNFPIGLFDIIHVKKENKYFIVLPSPNGFEFRETNENVKKVSKVKNKRAVRGGKIQVTFHDGETMIMDKPIKTNDTIIFNKNHEIESILPFKEGAYVMVVSGDKAGKVGKIKKIEIVKSSMPNRIIISIDGKDVESIPTNIFVVGDENPIEFPKVNNDE